MNNLGIFTTEGREAVADWVMHGNGRVYQRHEIQARIVRLLATIAHEVETLISTERSLEDAASQSTENRGDVHSAALGLPRVREDVPHDQAHG